MLLIPFFPLTVIAALFAYSTSVYASFSLPKLAVLVLGVIPFAVAIYRGRAVRFDRGAAVALAVFGAVALASAWQSSDFYLSIVGRYNCYTWGLLGLFLAVCYYACAVSFGQDLDLDWYALAGVAMAGYALAQRFGIVAIPTFGGRVIATLGSAYTLGMALAVISPLVLRRSMVGYGFMVAAILATDCRGALIAAAFGAVVYFVHKRYARGLTFALIVVSLAAGWMAWSTVRSWSLSNNVRIEIWKVASKAALERPWLGWGPDAFEVPFRKNKRAEFIGLVNSGTEVANDAHNIALQLWSTMGALGLFAFGFLVVALVKTIKHRPAVLAAFGAFLVGAMFNPVALEVLVLVAALVGTAAAVAEGKRFTPDYDINGVARAVLLMALCASVVCVTLMVLADRAYHRGGPAGLASACKLNPFELKYKVGLVNAGIDALGWMKDFEARAVVNQAMTNEAAIALRLRPGSAMSYYLAATAARIRGDRGAEWQSLKTGMKMDSLNEGMRHERLNF